MKKGHVNFLAVMAKVTCSEFSNVQGYDEGMTGYMISAAKFPKTLITKPKIQQIFVYNCNFAPQAIMLMR